MPNKVLMIAAIASRAYVQAAVDAGFTVIAIDGFCDVDTQKIAQKVLPVTLKHGQFVAEDFYQALTSLDLSNFLGLCIGAGFEASPTILQYFAERKCLIGNSINTILQVKNPHSFFAFCDAVNMRYPATQLSRPASTLGWLQKQIGGSGGAHIKAVLPLELAQHSTLYYQKVQAGTAYSCLFLSDAKHAQVIGFNEQWCAPSAILPYRFGGAVSHADVDEGTKNCIIDFISKATLHFGLTGINSCDFLLHEHTVYMLEINPRLSASLQLYQAKKGNLFAAHVQACMGELKEWPAIEKASRAMHIIYANQTAFVPPDMAWPEWVNDIPHFGSEIPAGAPICTVLASARSAKLAKQKVLQRTASL
ncbi:MAG: ATP-grasp domain-containing protein [Bdellovibrio sp.]|nr:ATP-grasp domain-containing protein [Methylotenera sp.]